MDDSLMQVLVALKLEKYAPNFIAEEVTELEILASLEEDDVKILIPPLGPRRHLTNHLKNGGGKITAPPPQAAPPVRAAAPPVPVALPPPPSAPTPTPQAHFSATANLYIPPGRAREGAGMMTTPPKPQPPSPHTRREATAFSSQESPEQQSERPRTERIPPQQPASPPRRPNQPSTPQDEEPFGWIPPPPTKQKAASSASAPREPRRGTRGGLSEGFVHHPATGSNAIRFQNGITMNPTRQGPVRGGFAALSGVNGPGSGRFLR